MKRLLALALAFLFAFSALEAPEARTFAYRFPQAVQSGPSVDVDAQAWADAVTSAGGTYSADDLTAMSTAIAAMKTAGVWTKMTVFGPLYGADLAGALVQYRGGSWESATNHNFVSGDYTRATGLAGNGVNKWLDSNCPVSALTNNSTSLGVYSRSSAAPDGQRVLGAFSSAGDSYFGMILHPGGGGTAYSDQSFTFSDSSGRINSTISIPAGLVVGTRTAANSHKLYQGSSEIATSSAAASKGVSDIASGEKVGVFTHVEAGSASGNSDAILGMYFIGTGLTAQNVSDLNSIIQALMTAAGRNV